MRASTSADFASRMRSTTRISTAISRRSKISAAALGFIVS